MNDPVNHPKHYTMHPSGIECIEIVEHMNFNLGNAMKYIWRAGEKGEEIEDLRKAQWCLEREVARLGRLRFAKKEGVKKESLNGGERQVPRFDTAEIGES